MPDPAIGVLGGTTMMLPSRSTSGESFAFSSSVRLAVS
jgi:hypothetical protein